MSTGVMLYCSVRSMGRHRRTMARTPRGRALERVRRPQPLSRLQDPSRRPDALRRPRPQRLAAGHARLLNRRLEARAARQLHRMDAPGARDEPASRGRQPTLPDAALDRDPNLGSRISRTTGAGRAGGPGRECSEPKAAAARCPARRRSASVGASVPWEAAAR